MRKVKYYFGQFRLENINKDKETGPARCFRCDMPYTSEQMGEIMDIMVTPSVVVGLSGMA